MPRPHKKRMVCCMPKNQSFAPVDAGRKETVVMSVDEYEAIRLIDLDGFTQEDCAEQMGVARTTVQSIYTKARGKIADAIVNGKTLVISGGEYNLCESYAKGCKKGCKRHCHRCAGSDENN